MLDDIIKERKKKLEAIRKAGHDPYPARVKRTFSIAKALEDFGELARSGKAVSLAGRLKALRDQGKIIFADIEDESGKIQIVLKEDETKEFEFWRTVLDLNDFIAVAGPLFETKKGEKSVQVKELNLATKSLLPPPDKWAGLEDVEVRLRERYVDLMVHPDVRELFRKKSIFWEGVREFLHGEGFFEVETSVLEPQAGGAEAEPFRTHHNALDADFFLRISLELQLKKLVVGGFESVFEIGRVFRNEGIDRDHLQDFTFMECYWGYHDYRDLMKLVETMYRFVIKKTTGGLATAWQGNEIDWSRKWPEVDYAEMFKQENDGLDPLEAPRAALFKRAKELKLEADKNAGEGRLVDLIYKKTVRPKLIQPCFLVNHPILVSPLSKASPANPQIAERFQVVACGTELGNGYSELNDPLDQRARFMEQMKLRKAGDKEAMALDEDFLRALEYGMPPTAGFGMSERVFAILMDKPVRETVLFPLMRPKKGAQ
ncbi:MAG: lysine--tRNA ligase [Patescibacteria group bacterium]|nr:lysine--tRNA ligase [Patescibacteria group bacterium]